MKNKRAILVSALIIAVVSVGCSMFEPKSTSPASNAKTGGKVGGNRPCEVHLPKSYVETKRYPVVVVLHGFGVKPEAQTEFFNFEKLHDQGDFILLAPRAKAMFKSHWNSRDAKGASKVRDVDYIAGLIDEVKKKYSVDPKHILIIGHSNGASMALRVACQRPSAATAIASLAGTLYLDPSECKTTGSLPKLLLMHGSKDTIVRYEGETKKSPNYPSAEKTHEIFSRQHACKMDSVKRVAASMDYTRKVPNQDTRIVRHDNCRGGAQTELWTIENGGHTPEPTIDTSKKILHWAFGQDVVR